MEKEWKQWQTLFLGGSTTTSDCNCSHEIKIYLLLGRKFVTNLDSILKSRDVTLSTKVGLVKAVVFLVITTSLSLSLFTFMHWRRKWQLTPVLLPRESQGWGSLVGCHFGLHRVSND